MDEKECYRTGDYSLFCKRSFNSAISRLTGLTKGIAEKYLKAETEDTEPSLPFVLKKEQVERIMWCCIDRSLWDDYSHVDFEHELFLLP